MYPSLAIFAVLAGLCLFVFARRITKNRAAVMGIQIMGIALAAAGIWMLYLVFSGKVVLPLSRIDRALFVKGQRTRSRQYGFHDIEEFIIANKGRNI